MADINARTRLLIGTTADWAAANLVLGDGELVMERAGGVVKMKAGDGATAYSGLPFVSAQPTIPPEYLNQTQSDARYLMLADVSTTAVSNKVPRLGATGMLALSMVPLPPVIDHTAGVADAGKLVMTALTGKLDQSLVPLPPAIDISAGVVDAGKLVKTASSGKVDPSLITVTTGTYRGLVDATAAKPAGTYLAGDYFLNTGSGTAHASWGFPGGTVVTPGQQLIFNGTTWDTVAGAAYLPISGGTLTGPLRVRDGGLFGGGAADARFDGLVIEGNAGTGISILSPAATQSGIAFGRPGVVSAGAVLYDHSADQLAFFAGGIGYAFTPASFYSPKPILAPDGTPTSPSYSFNSAAATGMFLSAPGTIAWATQAAQRMCLLPGANSALVIGGGATAAAWSGSLDINGPTNAGLNLDINGTCIGQMAAIPTAFNISAIGNLPMIFYTNAAERMRLTGQALTVNAANGIVVNGTSTPTLQVNDTTANGPSIKFVSNGGAKYIRTDGASGNFQILNGGYTAALLNLTDTGTLTDSTGWEVGWKDIPPQAANAAVSGSQRGSAIPITASPYTGLPASGMPIGSTVCLVNLGSIAISINGWAGLHLAGTTSTGNRVLAPYGFATVWYQSGTVAFITGNVS